MSATENQDLSGRVLEAGFEAIDPAEVDRLRRLLAAKEPGSTLLDLSPPQLLQQLGLLEPTQPPKLTAAGALLVGSPEALRRLIPGHEVVYLRMRNDTEYDRRIDSRRPLLGLLEQLSEALEPNNAITTLRMGMFHFEIPDFPPEVYREALLNALVHRDYDRVAPVYVRHYTDRIEISNPGGFFGGVSADNILGHEPVSRNPSLAEVLQRMRLVERAGMGVRRMYHIMLSWGKEPPSYEGKPDFVRITLRSGRTVSGPAVDESFAKFVAAEQKDGRELSLHDLLVLNYLKRNREIDLAEAERILQRSENEAREVLNSMEGRSLLEPFGQKKGRVYRLSKRLYTSLRTSVGYQIFRRAEAAFAENTITAYLEEMPEDSRYLTNEVVRTLLRVSPHQSGYILSNMVKKGRLALRGRGRSTRYYPTRQLSAF
jgi:ATP-dependent DNA helicase RecG